MLVGFKSIYVNLFHSVFVLRASYLVFITWEQPISHMVAMTLALYTKELSCMRMNGNPLIH